MFIIWSQDGAYWSHLGLILTVFLAFWGSKTKPLKSFKHLVNTGLLAQEGPKWSQTWSKKSIVYQQNHLQTLESTGFQGLPLPPPNDSFLLLLLFCRKTVVHNQWFCFSKTMILGAKAPICQVLLILFFRLLGNSFYSIIIKTVKKHCKLHGFLAIGFVMSTSKYLFFKIKKLIIHISQTTLVFRVAFRNRHPVSTGASFFGGLEARKVRTNRCF